MAKNEGPLSGEKREAGGIDSHRFRLVQHGVALLCEAGEAYFGPAVVDNDQRRQELYDRQADARLAQAEAGRPTPGNLAQERRMEYAPERPVSTVPLSGAVDFSSDASAHPMPVTSTDAPVIPLYPSVPPQDNYNRLAA